jgi:hypothetical protein
VDPFGVEFGKTLGRPAGNPCLFNLLTPYAVFDGAAMVPAVRARHPILRPWSGIAGVDCRNEAQGPIRANINQSRRRAAVNTPGGCR